MSVTTERLEEIVTGWNTVCLTEAESMARELLSLRTRDAGDDELEALCPHAVCNEEQSRTRKACDIAIDRGQQLRSSQADVGTLKEQNQLLHSDISVLTAERDSLQSQLAAMQSVSVEEVDGYESRIKDLSNPYEFENRPMYEQIHDYLQRLGKFAVLSRELRDLARNAIQQRDEVRKECNEVVGLLVYTHGICFNTLESLAADRGDEEGDPQARRMLEIVDAAKKGVGT